MSSRDPNSKAQYRPRDPSVTSRIMSAIRGTDNRAEIVLRRLLWRRGFRYRLYSNSLIGRPDIVLSKHRLVIFVDGDFWHGRTYIEGGITSLRASLKTARRDYWITKIRRTVERDEEVNARLRHEGWRVLRVWERTILDAPERTADTVAKLIRTPRPR